MLPLPQLHSILETVASDISEVSSDDDNDAEGSD
jgi:hypothetical protein